MDFVFFIPLGFILLILLLLIGGAYEIVRTLTQILFSIFVVTFFFIGLYVIVKEVIAAVKEKKPLWGVTEFLRGVFLATIGFYVFEFIYIGCGHVPVEYFHNAKFIIFGTFDKLDFFLVVFLLSVFSVVITTIPILKARDATNKKLKLTYQMTSVILMFLIYIAIYKIGIESEFLNSSDTFNWDSPEYTVAQDVAVKHDFGPIAITTGIFKEGTQLYANGRGLTFGGVEYFEVTDGVIVGYVSNEDLESLVTYSYFVNKDSNIYGIEKRDETVYSSEGKKIVTLSFPAEEIVATVSQGVQVELTGTTSSGYTLIRLSDGTEGFIENTNLDEIRE